MAENVVKDLKSEEISSPDQLNAYLRVTNPSVWYVFAVIFLILAAFFAWSCAGTIETLTDARAVVSDGTATLIMTSTEHDPIESGMAVRVEGTEFRISKVGSDEYGRTVAYAPVSLLNGTYDAKIVTESITPISFLLQSR